MNEELEPLHRGVISHRNNVTGVRTEKPDTENDAAKEAYGFLELNQVSLLKTQMEVTD